MSYVQAWRKAHRPTQSLVALIARPAMDVDVQLRKWLMHVLTVIASWLRCWVHRGFIRIKPVLDSLIKITFCHTLIICCNVQVSLTNNILSVTCTVKTTVISDDYVLCLACKIDKWVSQGYHEWTSVLFILCYFSGPFGIERKRNFISAPFLLSSDSEVQRDPTTLKEIQFSWIRT